jgi:hypothetical protein
MKRAVKSPSANGWGDVLVSAPRPQGLEQRRSVMMTNEGPCDERTKLEAERVGCLWEWPVAGSSVLDFAIQSAR